ncbi:MAG: FAD-binding protein [Candidatus Eisenbacteria bacterium]|nr:FAD-binding protein [Candidatus Eisenbacteria bacterium]
MDLTRYAMGGIAPAAAACPADNAAAAEAMRACAAAGEALLPWGGGVALAHESAPGRYDRALDLRAMNGMLTYEPDDFTLTAQCGITVAALRETLAARGQELPIEAAHADRATLGGVLAANASGARRLRFGAPRDRILGARFVTGDGTLARTGGRVVKNVAGHAVHRLLVGSRGGLGVLLEASLKLLPLPPARAALVHGADAALLADGARWAEFPRRECAALSVLGAEIAPPALRAHAAPFSVVTGFEDDATWVASCVAFAHEQLGAPAAHRGGAELPALWQALADLEETPGARLTFTSAHNTPDAIAVLADRDVAKRLVFHAPHGRLHLWPRPQDAAALVAELAPRGFRLIDARGVAVTRAASVAGVTRLRERLRDALDPARVMALGERWQQGA